MTQEKAEEVKKQKNTLLQFFALAAFAVLAFADLIVKDDRIPDFIFWALAFGWIGADAKSFVNVAIAFLTGRGTNEKS